jgi:natural product precursor
LLNNALMKKSHRKLSLSRETLRKLDKTELSKVVGGDCGGVTRDASTCTSTLHADVIILPKG